MEQPESHGNDQGEEAASNQPIKGKMNRYRIRPFIGREGVKSSNTSIRVIRGQQAQPIRDVDGKVIFLCCRVGDATYVQRNVACRLENSLHGSQFGRLRRHQETSIEITTDDL